jgi:hypothetical protein
MKEAAMAACPQCKAELRTDGVNSWCVQADCPSNNDDAFCAECGDELPPAHDPHDLCPVCAIVAEALKKQST